MAKIVVIGEELPVLPPGYSVCEGRLAYMRKVMIPSSWLLILMYLAVLSRKLAF